MHGSRARIWKNLNARQLDFTAVNSNNKNLNKRHLYSFLGHCRALDLKYVDARQSDFTAVHGNDGNLNIRQLYSFLEHCRARKFC